MRHVEIIYYKGNLGNCNLHANEYEQFQKYNKDIGMREQSVINEILAEGTKIIFLPLQTK